MQIVCFSPFGYEGTLVDVEVDLRRGIPAVDIVGLADNAVKESRERMRSAIVNSGLPFPPERVLINLSPADLKKEGAGFDLAVALAVLNAKDKTQDEVPEGDAMRTEGAAEAYADDATGSVLVIGELELGGRVRPVRAVHAAALTAHYAGINYCIVPGENAREARDVRGMKVFGAETLTEAFEALKDFASFTARNASDQRDCAFDFETEEVDGVLFSKTDCELAEVRGQQTLVRALQIAAAGGHNLLAFGPPGSGKTLSLQKFPALVPLLTREESQSVTRIYSVAGLLPMSRGGIWEAPFRQPHQSSSLEGMCGGGPRCTPGEISLAHNGALFLDEAAEFKMSVLQMLRVPLETGSVKLSRAGRSTVFPAQFQLLMSMNPCPCGNLGSPDKVCLCSGRSIEQYWRKISGPLLDRIDLRVQVEHAAAPAAKVAPATAQSTGALRAGVARAVKAQRARGVKNARLTPDEVRRFCVLTDDAANVLEEGAARHSLSQRAIASCLKLSRTICDMNGEESIGGDAVKEALFYRKPKGAVEMFR